MGVWGSAARVERRLVKQGEGQRAPLVIVTKGGGEANLQEVASPAASPLPLAMVFQQQLSLVRGGRGHITY